MGWAEVGSQEVHRTAPRPGAHSAQLRVQHWPRRHDPCPQVVRSTITTSTSTGHGGDMGGDDDDGDDGDDGGEYPCDDPKRQQENAGAKKQSPAEDLIEGEGHLPPRDGTIA